MSDYPKRSIVDAINEALGAERPEVGVGLFNKGWTHEYDWRSYVPPQIIEVWPQLSLQERMLVAAVCIPCADREDEEFWDYSTIQAVNGADQS